MAFPILIDFGLIQKFQKLTLYPASFLFDPDQFEVLLVSHFFVGLYEGYFGEEACVFSENIDIDESL
jgi:hypothetical protein